MDSMLDFDILNETIGYESNAKDFKEFCSNLNSLGLITNPRLYMEAMEDHNKSFIDRITPSLPLKKTRESVGDVKKAYDDATSGGGTLIRAVWDMSMKALQLSAKILKFILVNLAKVPKMIVGLAQTIARIPENVKNKIRGNISLYITVNDVNSLHKVLIPIIDSFLDTSNEVSKGNMWGTFFNRRPVGSGPVTKYVLTENDMSYYRKMKSSYEKLKLIEFKETVVKLENQNIVDIYFGGTKSIKYRDVNGRNIESNFYDALIGIFKEFQPQDEFLKRVQGDIGVKLDKSQMNQSFGRLNESGQKIVGETIQMISKGINIIGNLIRYIMTDIKTLKTSADKILKRDGISKVKNESALLNYLDFSKDELQAMVESFDGSFMENYGESFEDLYKECVELFEEKSAKVDEKTLRSLTSEEKKIADERFGGSLGCSIMWNKHGYFAKTHRARTDYYDTLEKLPKGEVKFVSSTG